MLKNRINLISLISLINFSLPRSAYAAIGSPWNPGCIQNGDVATISCLIYIIPNIISAVFGFVGIILVILIISTGLKYITSSGNPKTLQQIQQSLTWLIVGFAFIFFSFMIVRFLADWTGIPDILKLQLGP